MWEKNYTLGEVEIDQVALDVRMYTKDKIDQITSLLIDLEKLWWGWPRNMFSPSCLAIPTFKKPSL